MQTGTFELKLPFGPWGLNTLVGFSGDINVIPSGSELRRSVRQRYRLGMEKTAGSVVNFNGRIEGGRKKNYKRDGEIEIDWQYMYSFNFFLTIVTVENQSVFCKCN
jgi:hypothetical protein